MGIKDNCNIVIRKFSLVLIGDKNLVHKFKFKFKLFIKSKILIEVAAFKNPFNSL